MIADARAQIRQDGQTVTLRRLAGTSLTATDATCHAKINDAGLVPVDGAVKQNRRRIVLDPTGAEEADWPLPPRPDDQIVAGSVTYQIESVNEVRIGVDLCLYRIVAVA